MRRQLKHLVEYGLVWSGAPRVALVSRRSRTLILAYHAIVPTGESPAGDASLHLPQAKFAAQLDVLARTHDVVPLADALAPSPAGATRPRVAVTFDDAYQGAVTAGVLELVRRGMPATIFVPPGLLGGQRFWWDVLAPADGGALDPRLRHRALTEWRGQAETILKTLGKDSRSPAGPAYARSATPDELDRVAAQPGIVLGSHTWSHPNLAALDAATLEDELRRPLAWLRARYERVLPVLTYPYGLQSDAVQRAAAAAGYEAALCIDGGWVGEPRRLFALPRMDVPAAVSKAGFELRVSGVLS
ncbi:MAG TPA: polysaccharide deacetylase family protein [Gemmatimonadaceae bacterium]|nr:polysaccharide deacetylase family protein [Gemmatimonadaceae bacterium]